MGIGRGIILAIVLVHLVPIHCNQTLLDPCIQCRSDNSSCRVIAGIFTRPQLDLGYNLVAHIPRGACSLNITEIRRSSNHLAIRQKNSTFIFNGSRRLSHSGSYPGAGTVFHYQRQDITRLESITSPGPLHEPVDLLVLHQQPNPGIKYEFKVPPFTSNKITPAFPIHPTRQKPQVDTNLHTTLKSRSNKPQQDSLPSAKSNNNNRHLHFSKPVSTSQSHKNIYYWKIIGYTNCSEPCGGGVQRSIIHCVRGTKHQTDSVLVSERYCPTEEKPLEQRLRCNLKPCPAEWVIGDWSECKGKCGEGLMTRQVHCQQRVSPTLNMRVKEGACLQEKPEEERKCKLSKKCNRWMTSDWGPCSEKCGNGVRRREVRCEEDETVCDEELKPEDVRPCNMGPCTVLGKEAKEGMWMMSKWENACSTSCGSGLEYRHVVCSATGAGSFESNVYYGYSYDSDRSRNDTDVKTVLIGDEIVGMEIDGLGNNLKHNNGLNRCTDDKKPHEERECFSERVCEPQWFTGDWGECSSACGSGHKTRQVLCVHFTRGKFRVISEHLCTSEARPASKQKCNESIKQCPPRWFATEWSECSALCGGGFQKRIVSCRSPNGSKSNDSCNDDDRPIDKRTCNEEACSLLHKAADTHVREEQFLRENATVNKSVLTDGASELHRKEENDVQSDCLDDYRNCALVVQARLCRYKYYRSVCCRSCSLMM